ncbi:DUF2255 family protein [Altibacter sp.]|uniref:DUF2255 family protein n=1 Tax=Altibacter sp. TaxID=2024823 RepID=UPI000C9934F3|nr:DUF2255 family protein [Altibacter sp.]MAP54033.1 hypothetical protein [Altibacter sp.]
MSFPTEFFAHLDTHNYTEIKGGLQRETFLEIWVVTVGDRVFARSWNKSEKSWYTAFLEEGVGQLKFGAVVLDVTGLKVLKEDAVHQQIDTAYRSRYTEEKNIYYAQGISQPEYYDYTLELFYKPT